MEEPPDASLFYHDIHYVIRTWLEHHLHHTYPDAGAYNDQDEFLMLDWHTVNVYYIRVSRGAITSLNVQGGGVAWDSFLGR